MRLELKEAKVPSIFHISLKLKDLLFSEIQNTENGSALLNIN